MRKLQGIMFGGLVVVTGYASGCAPVDPSNPNSEVVLQQSGALHGAPANDNGLNRVRCPHPVPAALNPPAEATLEAAYPASGVQIYVCTAPADGTAPVWVNKAPHAVLFEDFKPAVIHFAGPSWQALDGSLVTGAKTASAPAPDGVSIPWLLLSVATHAGPGLFADATWIQRLATEGGAAPAATGCDTAHVGAQVLSPYAATYFFYHTAVSGQRVRQCAAN